MMQVEQSLTIKYIADSLDETQQRHATRALISKDADVKLVS